MMRAARAAMHAAALALLLSTAHGGQKVFRQDVVPAGIPVEGMPGDGTLDPGLRYLVARYAAAGTEAFTSENTSAADRWYRLAPGTSPSSPIVPVFLQWDDRGALSAAVQLGGVIRGETGNIATMDLPLARVADIATLPGVRSIQLSGIRTPALDLSRAATGADAVHAGAAPLDRSYKGNGVIVGILDSGLDWSHPDFSNAQGASRIRFLYDYSDGPTGKEWTQADITGGTCTAVDGAGGRGHGTHVAGTAAGSGRANTAYIGMAPEAEIVGVKATRDANSGGGFSDADIVGGIQYIFSKAAALNEPAVVNLSLGGHLGPHDGTSLLEQSISALTGPGRIVVASAGNEGSAYIHGGYAAQAGTGYSDALETLVEPAVGVQQIAVDMWYPGAPASISVGIAAYQPGNYSSAIAVTAAVPPGQAIQNVVLQSGTATLGRVTIDARTVADPNNGAHRVLFVLEDGGAGNLSNVIWSVFTFGSGTFDMWAVAGCRFTPVTGLPSYFHQGDNDRSVGSPATARKVISVASYVTKNTWIDVDGTTQTQPGNPTVGAISTFSSRGPSRDGRVLPQITAPGEAIIAALSSTLVAGTDVPRAEVLQGGQLQKLQGTSMASPHVAGVVALLLERNRYLVPENVASILGSTAEAVGAAPNNTWGWGKMRAVEAMMATPAAIDCATLARLYGIDCDGPLPALPRLLPAYPNPFNPTTTLAFQTPRAGRVDLGIYDVLGRRIRQLADGEVDAGLHQQVWDGTTDGGSAAGSGIYFIRLRSGDRVATQRVLLLK
jgi:subtilisin family serine protease